MRTYGLVIGTLSASVFLASQVEGQTPRRTPPQPAPAPVVTQPIRPVPVRPVTPVPVRPVTPSAPVRRLPNPNVTNTTVNNVNNSNSNNNNNSNNNPASSGSSLASPFVRFPTNGITPIPGSYGYLGGAPNSGYLGVNAFGFPAFTTPYMNPSVLAANYNNPWFPLAVGQNLGTFNPWAWNQFGGLGNPWVNPFLSPWANPYSPFSAWGSQFPYGGAWGLNPFQQAFAAQNALLNPLASNPFLPPANPFAAGGLGMNGMNGFGNAAPVVGIGGQAQPGVVR